MNIKNYNRVYFIGIGGIGMSSIARWFFASGYEVAGYDKTQTDLTNSLAADGITIIYNDTIDSIDSIFKNSNNNTLVIYTPAIPATHKGLNYFINNNYTVLKRSEILGLLVKESTGIAVAGTHGKTSISTTIAWLMNQQCNAFLGGISKNLNSNVIINSKAKNVIIEADEFDKSFLTLYPEIAVISSLDADHLDIYKDHNDLITTFHQFIKQIKSGGSLIYKLGLKIDRNINSEIKYFTYSLDNDTADFYATNIQIINGYYVFDWNGPDKVIKRMELGVPGLYNLENSVAALASAIMAGTDDEYLKTNLKNYQGVKRRFDYQIRSDKVVYIDDYAHHPEEIKVCIKSVRHLYPNKKITVVFQPHLYSRTKDFANEFAKSLDMCDEIILTDIYPAREEPIPGVDSNLIFNKIKNRNKTLCKYDSLTDTVLAKQTEIIITMGAGDIDRLVPKIKAELIKKYKLKQKN